MIEMPRYKCHKEVRALKIKELRLDDERGLMLAFSDERYAPIPITGEWNRVHAPLPGGYFVVYADGYRSFSSAETFESGYELVKQ